MSATLCLENSGNCFRVSAQDWHGHGLAKGSQVYQTLFDYENVILCACTREKEVIVSVLVITLFTQKHTSQ